MYNRNLIYTELEMSLFDTILNVKEKIEEIDKIPIEHQELFYRRGDDPYAMSALFDEPTIMDYGFKSGDVLILIEFPFIPEEFQDFPEPIFPAWMMIPEKFIEIRIKNEHGEIITLKVKENPSIKSIKEKIELSEKIPIENQILKKNIYGLEMEDDWSTLKYGVKIQNGDTLMLLVQEKKYIEGLSIPEAISTIYEHIGLIDEVKEAIIMDDVEKMNTFIDFFYFLNSPLSRDAQNNKKMNLERKALFFAVLTNSHNIVRYLCEHKTGSSFELERMEVKNKKFKYANPDFVSLGTCPLMAAVILKREKMIEIIAKSETSALCVTEDEVQIPNRKEKLWKPTAVCMAVAMNDEKLLQCLLQPLGAYYRDRDTKLFGPTNENIKYLWVTGLRLKSQDALNYLMENYSPNELQLIYHIESILTTATASFPQFIPKILTFMNDLQPKNRLGKDLHHYYSQQVQKAIHHICEKLQNGLMVTAMDQILTAGGKEQLKQMNYQMSPLHILSSENNEHLEENLCIEMAKVLLKHGADLQQKINGYGTPLDMAREAPNRKRLLKIFEDYENLPKCLICERRPKTHVYFPCGHKNACEICADDNFNCPTCVQNGNQVPGRDPLKLYDEETECVVCMTAFATHAFPECGHKVICQNCMWNPNFDGKCPNCRNSGIPFQINDVNNL